MEQYTEESLNEKIAEAKEHLAAYHKEAAAIRAKIEEAESLKGRLCKLAGSAWDRGNNLISRAEHDIAMSEHILSQLSKPRVVFSNCLGSEYIVEKVTAKQIYIQRIGWTHSSIYDKTGKSKGGSAQIDMQATFGSALEAK